MNPTDRIHLAFARISRRARAAIERAGGFVTFDRRNRLLVATMPITADWCAGIVYVRNGRPSPEPYEIEMTRHNKETVYFWRRPVGQCVLVSDDARQLWHWRDPECPWALPF